MNVSSPCLTNALAPRARGSRRQCQQALLADGLAAVLTDSVMTRLQAPQSGVDLRELGPVVGRSHFVDGEVDLLGGRVLEVVHFLR